MFLRAITFDANADHCFARPFSATAVKILILFPFPSTGFSSIWRPGEKIF